MLAVPRGHRFADRKVTLDELKDEPLVLMQEGAGVRQVIDDELRETGVRLRDLDVRLELGLQESARSAVLAGYGVTFISRSAIEADVAAGTRRGRARRRARAVARDLARALGRPRGDARRAGVRRVRASAARVIVRWGLDGAAGGAAPRRALAEPLLVASPRWDLPIAARLRAGARCRRERIDDAAALAGGGVVAVGGGSAIDLGKAISAAAGVPLVSVPTTYAGAEWTTYYGVRDPERKMRGGGAGAHPTGIVYEVELTLDLPREPTVGTAMNALAHCAEALYVEGHNEEADEHALAGAALIGEWLPRVVDAPHDREARTELLRGACHGGAALGGSGARARARDGAGGRRPLRVAARDAERHLPAARAALERAVGARGGRALPRGSRPRRRGARRARRRHAAARARRPRGGPAGACGSGRGPRRQPARTRGRRLPAEIEELLRSVW